MLVAPLPNRNLAMLSHGWGSRSMRIFIGSTNSTGSLRGGWTAHIFRYAWSTPNYRSKKISCCHSHLAKAASLSVPRIFKVAKLSEPVILWMDMFCCKVVDAPSHLRPKGEPSHRSGRASGCCPWPVEGSEALKRHGLRDAQRPWEQHLERPLYLSNLSNFILSYLIYLPCVCVHIYM